MPTCSWCKEPTHNEPVEHILLEGLVGDARFAVSGRTDHVQLILNNDEVCSVCNIERLSPLDGYLQKQLGVFKVFLNGTGTKHGKAPKVEKPGTRDWIVELRLGPVFFVDPSPGNDFAGGIGKTLEEHGFLLWNDRTGVVKKDLKQDAVKTKETG